MKLKFKIQAYQTEAVQAVVDCFKGQPRSGGIHYRIDPGKKNQQTLELVKGLGNERLLLSKEDVLDNIKEVQKRQNIPVSNQLVSTPVCAYNLDIEMETGTGKTYCYIKTIFELNRQYGWSKFIIVVPSIAIREGVYKSLEITADHFQETYGRKARFFIYNSRQLHNLESYSSDGGINVMVINMQAFNARGKDARRIYDVLDDFQSRKPIDVIKANNPILILDEPQKMGAENTQASLKEFDPLMILRYSATHKKKHNKIYRLDALDAYTQKLVKKISVRGISVRGLAGSNAYLYLESIQISKQAPEARLEFEVKTNQGIKRILRKVKKDDNLYELSNELAQYKGFRVSDIDGRSDTITFTNGVEIAAGEAVGDVHEGVLRRIQIRETIKAHLEKEQVLYYKGIKVLSLFFIDEVAKYRQYDENGENPGAYAQVFEEEYHLAINELGTALTPEYRTYLEKIPADKTHQGYFSIDKKTRRFVDSETGKGSSEADDVDAYDLILKKKEQLLSMDEPVRFIFSHSALREGWDNPNVFVICTLKHSDNTVTRRQEVGRGLRLSVDQNGDRQDQPSTVHQINVLTVVANESYKDFVKGLQSDLLEGLSDRPQIADARYFTGKVIQTDSGTKEVPADMAAGIEFYLIQNGYVDRQKKITEKYHEAVKRENLAPLPVDLVPYEAEVHRLISSVFSQTSLPKIENERNEKTNPLNDNFHKKEFKALWNRINKKAVYTVHFDSEELIKKAVPELDAHLRITPLTYRVEQGTQKDDLEKTDLEAGESFVLAESRTPFHQTSVHSTVSYDLIGKIAEGTQLTRRTIATILGKVDPIVFQQYRMNPEDFISEAIRLIQEQKATLIVEHLQYDTMSETHDISIFMDGQLKQKLDTSGGPLKRHVYDYVVTDSKTERTFAERLDVSDEVVVYAKLPKGFAIPTPVGDYNPDWAITFKEGAVKHIYFVAETKGSMSSMQLRAIEDRKIECARRFFDRLNKTVESDKVKYDVVSDYDKLMDLVNG